MMCTRCNRPSFSRCAAHLRRRRLCGNAADTRDRHSRGARRGPRHAQGDVYAPRIGVGRDRCHHRAGGIRGTGTMDDCTPAQLRRTAQKRPTKAQLARLLAPFGIRPAIVHRSRIELRGVDLFREVHGRPALNGRLWSLLCFAKIP
jgi:hypothetical protein